MSNPYPVRLTVLRALTEYFEAITPTNGFVMDMSPVDAQTPRVYRGRTTFDDGDPLPCLSILEAPNPDSSPTEACGGLLQRDDWLLLVQGWAEKEQNEIHPTDNAHIFMADVKKALGNLLNQDHASYMLGGVIDGLKVEPGVVRPPDETSSRSYFYLRIVVQVAERLDDPYRVVG